MTNEQRVKRVYPEAVAVEGLEGGRWIYRIFEKSRLDSLIGTSTRREDWAWADAWRRIKAQAATVGRAKQ